MSTVWYLEQLHQYSKKNKKQQIFKNVKKKFFFLKSELLFQFEWSTNL